MSEDSLPMTGPALIPIFGLLIPTWTIAAVLLLAGVLLLLLVRYAPSRQ